uniref:Uncharacterized protein n=1 Tax=viral metagenome TaxID=1070528 RepID=A0A6M3K2N8_9ZZZZ
MRFNIISESRKSQAYRNIFDAEGGMETTLEPIVLAHEVMHIKLGHLDLNNSFAHKPKYDYVYKEIECWAEVFKLREWSESEIKQALNYLRGMLDSECPEYDYAYDILSKLSSILLGLS